MEWKDSYKKMSPIPLNLSNYTYQNLIDIIIPVYNDRLGLKTTLGSLIGVQRYNIIIIDDCSTDKYDDIIQFFGEDLEINYYQTECHGGPAAAKNAGIKHSLNKYITFMDAGDTFITPDIIVALEKQLEDYKVADFLTSGYYEMCGDRSLLYIPHHNNTWRGKVYNRKYVLTNDLHFLEETSLSNDDIGMNMLGRLISDENRILTYDYPVMAWNYNANSVTRRNNYQSCFKDTSWGTVMACQYALNQSLELGVLPPKRQALAYETMGILYFNYLNTKYTMPEYTQDCLDASSYFYKNCFMQFPIDLELLLNVYNYTLLNKLQAETWDACVAILNTDTFMDFLDAIKD